MNLKGLKKKSALKFLRKNDKNKEFNVERSLKKIHKIGVLAEAELFKTYDFTKKLSENLGVNLNYFNIILFQNVKANKLMDSYDSFTEKDFGMYGKIKNVSLNSFVESKFDLLINYSSVDNVFSHVVCLRSNAKIKASFKNEEFNFYDIAIDIKGNKIDTFNEELTKYLHILELLK